MQTRLPTPTADAASYESILDSGLRKFPKRRENYENYYSAERKMETKHLPIMMDIEPVSRCNFHCTMCQVSEWSKGARAKDMSLRSFKELLERLFGLVEIKLQGLGEPLLNLDIFDMIRLAREKDIWVRLTTNGSLLHIKDNYQRLIDADPGEVQISIDGATSYVFEKIRKGSNFDRIKHNVKKLNVYDQNQGSNKTRAWTLVQKANFHELKDIVRLCSEVDFRRLTFSMAISYFGNDYWTDKNKSIEAYDEFNLELGEELIDLGNSLGIDVTFWDAGSKYSLNGNPNGKCAWLWQRAFISSDLKVVPCCVISNPEIIDFGDARDFSKIWNSGKYIRLRKNHLKGKLPEFCKQCYGLV